MPKSGGRFSEKIMLKVQKPATGMSGRRERVATPPPATIVRALLRCAAPGSAGLGRAPSRRDGRVAEGARLESVYTGNRIVGSNPTPSARHMSLSLNDFFGRCEGRLTFGSV